MQSHFLLLMLCSLYIFATADASDAIIEWTANFEERNITVLDDENFVEDITIVNAVKQSVKEGSPRYQKPNIFENIKKAALGSGGASIDDLVEDIEALEEMDDRLLAKVNKQDIEISKNRKDIEILKKQLGGSPTRRPTTRPEPKKTCDGLIYQGRCYFGIFYLSGRMTYAEAEDICDEKGAVVGHFRRVDHYNKMIQLLRNELERVTPDAGWSTIINSFLWLGMKIDWETEKIQTVADGPVFQLWQKNYPTRRATYTAVFFEVNFYDVFGKPDEGMKNTTPTSGVNGVLCEKPY